MDANNANSRSNSIDTTERERNSSTENFNATTDESTGVTRNQEGKIVIPSASIKAEHYQLALPHLENPIDETYESREVETLFRKISEDK